jgi:hypothetical protein
MLRFPWTIGIATKPSGLTLRGYIKPFGLANKVLEKGCSCVTRAFSEADLGNQHHIRRVAPKEYLPPLPQSPPTRKPMTLVNGYHSA